jgi:hypothetical protein
MGRVGNIRLRRKIAENIRSRHKRVTSIQISDMIVEKIDGTPR